MTAEQRRIWEYYRSLADVVGMKDGAPQAYSVKCFFPAATDNFTPNAFVRAFLGDDVADDELPALPVVDDFDKLINESVSDNPRPYAAQLEGIKNALTSRISLVQGPPGTGKTEMIVNLLSVIHRADPNATVAVLSPNNEALDNICEKIEKDGETSPEIAELKRCFSRLGNQKNRAALKKKLEGVAKDNECDEQTRETAKRDARFFHKDYPNYIRPGYLKIRPIFTSTLHSLLSIFKYKGKTKKNENSIEAASYRDYGNMFDYIIIDECSQLSVLNGVAAMSRVKKSLVLVGDDEQLKPIIKENVDADIPEIYKEAEGKSFLGVCEEIFGNKSDRSDRDSFKATHAFLNEHYRCHPSIIGFCNKYVYGEKLKIKTQSSGEFRMRAKWYEGSYCEFRDTNKNNDNGNDNNGNDDKKHRVKVNNKQIEIFIREELPRIRNTEQSVVVLCPYWYELDVLKKRLDAEAQAAEVTGDEATGVFTLTIHKSQGKGYDIVYLLTVDDYEQKDPWSQKKELINVAVSRAKREFCIITSAVWLPEEMKPDDLRNVLPEGEKADSEESRFYCKLLEYIRDCTMNMSAEELGDYGFHKTEYESVFDKVPVYKELNRREQLENERRGLKKPDKYAPELCMEQVLNDTIEKLNETANKKLKLYDHALIADVYSKSSEKADCEAHKELFDYVYGNEKNKYNAVSHFDFVICEESHDENVGEEKVRLIIEVDGAFHRYDNFKDLDADKKRDENKNEWVKDILQAGGIFLRFPTDGSRIKINDHVADETEDETIRRFLENTNPTDIWYKEGRMEEIRARLLSESKTPKSRKN